MAWEYNCPPCPVECGGARPVSFPGAGGKVIVAAMCRDREDLEVGLAECFGRPGTAHVTLALPHRAAALTNLTGGEPKPLEGLVPPAKRAMLKQYSAEKGHPPRGV